MTDLPLNKQFTLQKICNDIDSLNEKQAKQIAKEFAKLYHIQQHVVMNLLISK